MLKVRYVRADSGDEYFDIANGRITHGGQFLAPSNRRVPMMYYHADSGIGKALINHDPAHPRRIGIIGLGAGTIAAYAEPNETFRSTTSTPKSSTSPPSTSVTSKTPAGAAPPSSSLKATPA